MIPKVIIDPLVNILYASFYIEGFYQIYGKRNVKFSSKPFKKLSLKSRMAALDFVVIDTNGKNKKYIISFYDSYKIIKELYEWCDVYGSVNANFTLTTQAGGDTTKLVPLAPSFGVRIWSSFITTAYYALTNLIKGKISTKESFNYRNLLGRYKRMYRMRLPYHNYVEPKKVKTSKKYVFHLSTLWYNDEWNKNDEGVNKTRANFTRACKEIKDIDFEGGMVSQGATRSSEKLFSDCIYPHTVSMEEWMDKTKKSSVVFNTPAFWNCHGWKLGEYLALGKAIISTPLYNDLPAPLIHRKNIHIVEDNQQTMKETLILMVNDDKYREKLEENASEYWQQYGTPVKSLELLGIK